MMCDLCLLGVAQTFVSRIKKRHPPQRSLLEQYKNNWENHWKLRKYWAGAQFRLQNVYATTARTQFPWTNLKRIGWKRNFGCRMYAPPQRERIFLKTKWKLLDGSTISVSECALCPSASTFLVHQRARTPSGSCFYFMSFVELVSVEGE